MSSSTPLGQLLLPLALDDQFTLDNFQPLGEPRRAALAALQHSAPVMLLVGAPQSGLSHLLQGVAATRDSAVYLPLAELREFAPEQVLAGLEQCRQLLLDDVDAVWQQPHWAEALFALYNRCSQSGAGWLAASHSKITPDAPPLADLASRLSSGLIFYWPYYSDAELAQLLVERAARRGLTLGAEVTNFLLNRLARQPAALMTALEQLDRHSLTTGRAITIPQAKQALAL